MKTDREYVYGNVKNQELFDMDGVVEIFTRTLDNISEDDWDAMSEDEVDEVYIAALEYATTKSLLNPDA